MRKILFAFILFFGSYIGFSQEVNPLIVKDDFENQKKWVDSIYDNMTLQEKLGQLFMVDIFSSDPKSKSDRIKNLITEYHLGGVIFSKGGPLRSEERRVGKE